MIAEYKLSDDLVEKRKFRIQEIKNILEGKDKRKLILIGPCSADREDAVIDYVKKLARLQKDVADKILFVPRVYTSKPRTNGLGYKGLIHRPSQNSTSDDMLAGLIAVRKMHLHVIEKTGMFYIDY